MIITIASILVTQKLASNLSDQDISMEPYKRWKRLQVFFKSFTGNVLLLHKTEMSRYFGSYVVVTLTEEPYTDFLNNVILIVIVYM